jgi:hypothetical protein
MDPKLLGYLGAILGSLFGLLGGAIGTWCSIRNTGGPRERTFIVRAAIGGWIFVLAFVAGLFLLPQPYNFLLWVPYLVLLVLGIVWLNRRQARIRAQETLGQE